MGGRSAPEVTGNRAQHPERRDRLHPPHPHHSHDHAHDHSHQTPRTWPAQLRLAHRAAARGSHHPTPSSAQTARCISTARRGRSRCVPCGAARKCEVGCDADRSGNWFPRQDPVVCWLWRRMPATNERGAMTARVISGAAVASSWTGDARSSGVIDRPDRLVGDGLPVLVARQKACAIDRAEDLCLYCRVRRCATVAQSLGGHCGRRAGRPASRRSTSG